MYENGMGVSVSAYVYVCEKIPVYICISRSSFMNVSEYVCVRVYVSMLYQTTFVFCLSELMN